MRARELPVVGGYPLRKNREWNPGIGTNTRFGIGIGGSGRGGVGGTAATPAARGARGGGGSRAVSMGVPCVGGCAKKSLAARG